MAVCPERDFFTIRGFVLPLWWLTLPTWTFASHFLFSPVASHLAPDPGALQLTSHSAPDPGTLQLTSHLLLITLAFLAPRAPTGPPPTDDRTLKIRTAPRTAATILPSMRKKPCLRILPVLIHGFNRSSTDLPSRPVERRDLPAAQRSSPYGGMKMGTPQNFVCHPVTDSGKALLHQ